MAENHLPAPWCPRNEVVAHDFGGWISGGSASDQILPADLEPGDRIIHDGAAVTVERTRPSGRDWIITWYQDTRSGVFDVDRRERITRLAKDTDTA